MEVSLLFLTDLAMNVSQKDVEGGGKSLDPDKTAPITAVLTGSAQLVLMPILRTYRVIKNELHRGKTNKMACAPSEEPDQPGHPSSLIRVFAVRLKKARILSYPLSAQQRL